MGKFIENEFSFVQLKKGDIVDGKVIGASAGIIQTEHDLTYTPSGKSTSIKVPAGYITDGYSKPWWAEIIVGGRFEDDLRPSTLHDYLCQKQGFETTYGYIPLNFDTVNNLFYEAMIDVGISPFKAWVMRKAVNYNPKKW